MLYWQRVVEEVTNKTSRQRCWVTTESSAQNMESNKRKRTSKRYYFSDSNSKLYLTHREAGCMSYIIQGMTIKETAKQLGLSHRTVEFYLKRIKIKLNCNNRHNLIELLNNEGFIAKYRGVDFRSSPE